MMGYSMGRHAQRTFLLKTVCRNLPDSYTAEWRDDTIEVWQRSPQRKVGDIKCQPRGWGVYSYATGRDAYLHSDCVADAALWIIEQLGQPPVSDPCPSIGSLFGAFRGATGGMSSVEFVRAIRDEE